MIFKVNLLLVDQLTRLQPETNDVPALGFHFWQSWSSTSWSPSWECVHGEWWVTRREDIYRTSRVRQLQLDKRRDKMFDRVWTEEMLKWWCPFLLWCPNLEKNLTLLTNLWSQNVFHQNLETFEVSKLATMGWVRWPPGWARWPPGWARSREPPGRVRAVMLTFVR